METYKLKSLDQFYSLVPPNSEFFLYVKENNMYEKMTFLSIGMIEINENDKYIYIDLCDDYSIVCNKDDLSLRLLLFSHTKKDIVFISTASHIPEYITETDIRRENAKVIYDKLSKDTIQSTDVDYLCELLTSPNI